MLGTLRYFSLIILLLTLLSGCDEPQPENEQAKQALESVTDAQMYHQLAQQLLFDIRIAMPIAHIKQQLSHLQILSYALLQQAREQHPGCAAYFDGYLPLFDKKQKFSAEKLVKLNSKVSDNITFTAPRCFHLIQLALAPARMQAQLNQPAQKWTQYRLLEPQAIALTYHWQHAYPSASE